MEGMNRSAESGNWEVYKDAFALPPPSRTIKAWERAPVPAHAPRLHGLKIWKKAGIKSTREQEKENFDIAQKELETEGNGSRKRMRICGAKEAIGDASWTEGALPKSSTIKELRDHASADAALTSFDDLDVNMLQFIPRKRTNTNHVITPRKPLRQATLNSQAQTQAIFDSPKSSSEKPVRRRKSMRKSIRKSVSGGILGPIVAREEESPIVEPSSEPTQAGIAVEYAPKETLLRSAFEGPVVGQTVPDEPKRVLEVSDPCQFVNEEQEQNCVAEEPQSLNSDQWISQGIRMPLSDLKDTLPETTNRSISRDISKDEETRMVDEAQSSQALNYPQERQSAILDSIETNVEEEVVRPQKVTSTPRKRRGASQRRGTRRSTRTTRASSARIEDVASESKNSDSKAPGSTQDEASNHTTEIGIPHNNQEPLVQEIEQNATKEVVTTLDDPVEMPDNISVNENKDQNALPEQASQTLEVEEHNQEVVLQLENEAVDSEHADGPEISPAPEDAKLESLEISIEPEPIWEDFAVEPQEKLHDDELELLATPIPVADESINEVKREVASNWEAGLASPPGDAELENSLPARFSPAAAEEEAQSPSKLEDLTLEAFETLEPISIQVSDNQELSSPPAEDLPETSTQDATTSELVEAISENAPAVSYNHDDTDMLRSFLTRVKANKAAKEGSNIPKRKRSLPHSPLRLPLGEVDNNISPSPQKVKDDEFDVGLPGPSPSKRRKRNDPILVDEDDTITEEPKSIRRSGRTRLPVVRAPLGAPSFIPVRRLGQDGDTTVTLRRSEEKELAALTRVNTRKNKGGALAAADVLAKKAEEKDDPVLRQRLLKEVFDNKTQKGKKEKKGKSVAWAEELAQFQTVEGSLDVAKDKGKEKEKGMPVEEKKNSVRVGIRSKIALGMAMDGTPAPKRKRARS